ncbi:MAG: DUF6176 family protein [Cyanophyceae cyanobacterium]
MYETQLLKIKIKPNQTHAAQQFIKSLNERREWCLETFRQEGMVVESMFFEHTPAGDFLYLYAKARSLAEADRVFKETTDSLRLKIKEFVEQTWGETVALEPLLDLDLIEEADPLSDP